MLLSNLGLLVGFHIPFVNRRVNNPMVKENAIERR
jgi:hypothetical protein